MDSYIYTLLFIIIKHIFMCTYSGTLLDTPRTYLIDSGFSLNLWVLSVLWVLQTKPTAS